MIRLGILGSTRGTAMQAIVDAIASKRLAAQISIVVSNKKEAGILARATAAGLLSQFVDPVGCDRDTYDRNVSKLLGEHQVDMIVLVGYMRILSAKFTKQWAQKIINVHPSLLPDFSGLMDLDVHRSVIAAGKKQTGCTVHYVTEEVDAGPILLQKTCEVVADDTPEMLKARVQALEGEALVEALEVSIRIFAQSW